MPALRISLLLPFLIAALGASAHASAESQTAATIAREAQRYHACIVAASIQHGRLRRYAAGNGNGGNGCNDSSLFELGSVTKLFTGFVLAHDVATGRSHFDDTVASYLPGWKIPSRANRQITVLDLATHTSGLPRDSKVDDQDGDPDATYEASDMRTELAALYLAHVPGSSYQYSNLGSGLLGYALAQHDGRSLETEIQTLILEPLGMHSTVANRPGYSARTLLRGTTSDGTRAEIWHATPANLGASGYLINLDDMIALLKGTMHPDCLSGLCEMAQQPRRASDGGHTGLFWEISDGQIWKDGETDGYASFIGMTQDRQCGFVILSNTGRDEISDVGYKTFLPACRSEER